MQSAHEVLSSQDGWSITEDPCARGDMKPHLPYTLESGFYGTHATIDQRQVSAQLILYLGRVQNLKHLALAVYCQRSHWLAPIAPMDTMMPRPKAYVDANPSKPLLWHSNNTIEE